MQTEISFDPESLTAREVFVIEDYTGSKFADLVDNIDLRALVAIAYVILRRENSDLTIDQVEELQISKLTETLSGNV